MPRESGFKGDDDGMSCPLVVVCCCLERYDHMSEIRESRSVPSQKAQVDSFDWVRQGRIRLVDIAPRVVVGEVRGVAKGIDRDSIVAHNESGV